MHRIAQRRSDESGSALLLALIFVIGVGLSLVALLTLTALLGLAFLFGQWLAWLDFRGHGFRASTSGPSPFFYVLTGAHGLHLVGGILVLIYAALASLFHKSIEHRRIVVEVTRWYWHFMGILWIYVFALLWLAQ